ncbi:hypothetical protein [Alloacidobacterium dinghuense]|nr:hypothetical protein [Alloacidobacterium dinghuense]
MGCFTKFGWHKPAGKQVDRYGNETFAYLFGKYPKDLHMQQT